MTKTPIEPGDILEGDLIRCEYGGVNREGNAAVEYYAACDGFYVGGTQDSFFRLDSPKPPVVLPSEVGHYLPSYENPEVPTLDAADALDADLNSEIIQWLRVRAEGVAA